MSLIKLFLLLPIMFFLGYSNAYAANLEVQVTKQSDWSSGFCSNVSIFNPNDNIEEWNISFNANGLITSLWNANYSQNQTTLETTAHGVGWNNSIQPHSSITFGYCASKVETVDLPLPTPPLSADDLLVTQTTNAEWNEGFCKNVKVKNNTSSDIDWEVSFAVEGIVYTLWSANYSQNIQTLELTTSGVDWNNIVYANSQVEFGYCANKMTQAPDPDQLALDTDKNSLTFETIKLDNNAENNIKTALTLPLIAAEGSTISWSSDNGAIAIDGQLTQPDIGESNQVVRLTATLTKGSLIATKSFTLTVIALEMSDADILAIDIANLRFSTIKSNNTIESEITSNLNLINSGENATTITWTSSNTGVILTTGSVIRPAFGESDASVTIIATVTKGSISEDKTFNLIVLVNEESIPHDSKYEDDRSDYIANEIATDYNAGFTGALAGMIELSISTPITPIEGHFAVGYLPSWSMPWFSDITYASSQVATVDNLYTHVVISFAKPNLTFNGTDWSGTGVQFSSDITAVKKAIEVLQARGVKVILAVGGATYNAWSGIASEQGQNIANTTHKKALKAMMDTLNLDGIDVDYEIMGIDSANINKYYKSILSLKEVVGDKLLTVAGWSTGADCTANTIESAGCDGRISWWGGSAGRERMVFDMLESNGHTVEDVFDYVTVMSYDGGINRFDPIRLFKNYQEIYNGPIALGFQLPAEAWGGAELVATNAEAQGCESSSMISGDSYSISSIKEPYSVERFVDFVNSVPNSGVMLWSLYKTKGATNCVHALSFERFNSVVKSRLDDSI